MKKLIFLTLFITLTLGFTLQSSQANIKSIFEPTNVKQTSLNACSNSQTNAVYQAIAACQYYSQTDTVICIKNKLIQTINQEWDVFAKRNFTLAAVSFWNFNCYIYLNNYGSYSRTYIAWPSQSYSIKKDLRCTQAQYSSVYIAIKGCQMYDEQSTVQCILNTLRSNLNEYWDAYVAYDSSFADIVYWYYDSCSYQVKNFGIYGRNYQVWKAY